MPKSPAERKAAQQSASGEHKVWGLLSLDIKYIIEVHLIKNRTL